jgi:hypothetical protein
MKDFGFWVLILASLLYLSAVQSASSPPSAASDLNAQNQRPTPVEKQPNQVANKPRLTFGGYPCNADCSEDQAGYRWAEEHGITDPDSCTGDSGNFIEGCRVYAQRRGDGTAAGGAR